MTHQYYFVSNTSALVEATPTIHSPVNRILAASGRVNNGTTVADIATGNMSAGSSLQWVQFVTETVNAGGGSWPGVGSWPSGNYSIYYNVTAAGNELTYGALTQGSAVGHFGRINNSGTTDVSTQAAASGLTGTGVKSHTISWTPGGSTSTDRLEVVLAIVRATGGHGNQSATLSADQDNANTTNGGVIVTPHSDSPATLSGTIRLIGSPTVAEINSGNATGSYPTGVQANDLILALVVHADGTNPTLTPPSGFTSVQAVQDGNSKIELFRYWYVGSGDPTLTFTSSVSNDMTLLIVAYRFVDLTSPLYGLTPATTSNPGTEISLTKGAGARAGVALLWQGVDPGTFQPAPLPVVSPTGGTTPKPVTFPGTAAYNLALRTDDAANNVAMVAQLQQLEIAAGSGTHYMVNECTQFSNMHSIMIALQQAGAQSIAVGAASETETAVAVGAVQTQSIAVGAASETETVPPTADGYVRIDNSGDFVSTPDSNDYDQPAQPTSAILVLVADVALDQWQDAAGIETFLLGKWGTTAGTQSVELIWDAFNENIRIYYRDDSQTQRTATNSTSLVGAFSDGQRVQISAWMDFDTGDIEFYYRTDGIRNPAVSGWTYVGVGSTVTSPTIQDTTSDVTAGNYFGGGLWPLKHFGGWWELQPGVAPFIRIAQPDWRNVAAWPYTDSTGRVWTLAGSATYIAPTGLHVRTSRSVSIGAASETESAVAVGAVQGGQTIAVGAASETESAVAVGVAGVVSVAIGAASETETAVAVTADTTITVAVGASAETETAQPIQIDRSVLVGPASETESAVAVAAETSGAPQSITVNPAAETETAVAVTADTTISISVGAASETESAVAVGTATTVTIAITAASEVETAIGITADTAISIAVSPAAETETAVGIVINQGQSVAVGAASETETAQTITADTAISLAVGPAAEVETAQTVVVNFSQSIAVGAASETETGVASPAVLGTVVNVLPASETETAVAATPVPGAVSVAIGAASETETAQPVSAVSSISVTVGPASETESATSVTADTTVSISIIAAAETETGVAVGALPSISVSVAAASETESAVVVGVITAGAPQSITVNPASETETAVGVTADTAITIAVTAAAETETATTVAAVTTISVTVAAASETESAVTVAVFQAGAPQSITVNPASETETAFAVAVILDQSISVGAAAETETAQPASVATSYTAAVGAASETETAVAVGAVAGNVNVTVTPAAEIETARPVGINGNVIVNIGAASETETAFTTTVDTSYSVSIGWAQEVETAVAVPGVFPAIIAVGPASETEIAYSVGALGKVPDVVVTNITLTDNGARSVIVNDTGRRSVDVRYYSGA